MKGGKRGDGERSRRRILDAAAAEFAAVGISGARVDRIAAASGVNKSQMYSYFGSKDGLFDAVLDDQLDAIVAAVPLTADDLPGYAARFYDSYVARPELQRLATWYRLERAPAGDLLASFEGRGAADPRMETIADEQRAGRIDATMAPYEVYSLVVAIAMTWSPVNVTYAASADDAESEHARRRAVIREAVSRALVPNDQG